MLWIFTLLIFISVYVILLNSVQLKFFIWCF